MIKRAGLVAAFTGSLILLSLLGCKTVPPTIPEGLSQMEFFQRAQEESDNSRWDNALVYYKTFLERFPDDLPNVLAARYEVAFLTYKKEQYEEAKKLFNDLLDTYKSIENPFSVPQWPKVLSEKLIKKIDEKLIVLFPSPVKAEDSAAAAPAAPADPARK